MKRISVKVPEQLYKELKKEAEKHKNHGVKPPLWEVIAMWREGWIKSNDYFIKNSNPTPLSR